MVREGHLGELVLLFNLYLAGHDVWNMALSNGKGGDRAWITTRERSCTVPFVFDQRDGTLANGAPSVNTRTLLLDDIDARRTLRGYVEIFEMGEVVGNAENLVQNQNCGRLLSAWIPPDGFGAFNPETAMSPPGEGLSGSGWLVSAANPKRPADGRRPGDLVPGASHRCRQCPVHGRRPQCRVHRRCGPGRTESRRPAADRR